MQFFSWQGFKIEVRRRPYQRTLSLRVPAPGFLRVSCSQRLALREIFSFIEEKRGFIEAREQEWRNQLSRASVQKFANGEKCLFLGEERCLDIREHTGRGRAELKGDQLLLKVPSLEPCHIQETLIRFYKKAGRNYLSHLVKVQSEKMGLFPRALSFRSQRTRWGSCSSQGKISLNWRLIVAPSEVAEYVVIHELAHLRHPNHSQQFWSLVENFSPDYRRHKKWLGENQIQFEFLDPEYLQLIS